MIFKSNIAGVISRTQRLRNHDIPTALKLSLDLTRWETLAFETAEKTLSTIAQPGQEPYVRKFLATLRGTSLANGFLLHMHTPFGESATVEDIKRARAAVSNKDLGSNLFLGGVLKFQELVNQWVAEEKDKDQRDTGKTDEEIGGLISYLLLTPNPTPHEAKARAALLPHIADFIQRKQAEDKLDVATVDAWLKAVLSAWCKMVKVHFGAIFKTELEQQRGELALPA